MVETWGPAAPGVLRVPSGRLVRGRSLRNPAAGADCPTFGLHLAADRPPAMPWTVRWVRWPDFWLPTNRSDARDAFDEAWHRAATERIEVACTGGRGRTGTALACLAVLDGAPAAQAIEMVRRGYDPRAIETPWQRRYVRRFARGH